MNEKTTKTSWGQVEKENWFRTQKIQRFYKDDVVSKITELKLNFSIIQYGALSIDSQRYPLFALLSKNFDPKKRIVLITGGVHGYETSGVQGALAFMKEAQSYERYFNFICAPCVSPWSYESINRWNPNAIDPNRSFFEGSPAEECQFLINMLSPYIENVFAHFDLHETTDTDNTVFRPALSARDGKEYPITPIPDGFYVVGDTENPCPSFQKSIIDAVKKVTHIAPPDEFGQIIGEPLEQEGTINYPLKKLSLCTSITKAKYTTTTEVYPDSPKATDKVCIDAQVEAIKGGLDFIINNIS